MFIDEVSKNGEGIDLMQRFTNYPHPTNNGIM